MLDGYKYCWYCYRLLRYTSSLNNFGWSHCCGITSMQEDYHGSGRMRQDLALIDLIEYKFRLWRNGK